MNLALSRDHDPALLLEASRVLNAAGIQYATVTRLLSDRALLCAEDADPDTRSAIVGDAVALRLRKPGHYNEALDLLKDIPTAACPDAKGRLRMLRALANGQKYTQLRRNQDRSLVVSAKDLAELSKEIRSDLKSAFDLDSTLQPDNVHYWQPLARPRDMTDPRHAEDDLRQIYADDPEFRKLVDSPPTDASRSPAAAQQ